MEGDMVGGAGGVSQGGRMLTMSYARDYRM